MTENQYQRDKGRFDGKEPTPRLRTRTASFPRKDDKEGIHYSIDLGINGDTTSIIFLDGSSFAYVQRRERHKKGEEKMYYSVKNLKGYAIGARDGGIGKVDDFYFDGGFRKRLLQRRP
jgi:hypothetical protein